MNSVRRRRAQFSSGLLPENYVFRIPPKLGTSMKFITPTNRAFRAIGVFAIYELQHLSREGERERGSDGTQLCL